MRGRFRITLAILSVTCLLSIAALTIFSGYQPIRQTPPIGFRWEKFHDGGFGEIDSPRQIVAGPNRRRLSATDQLAFFISENATPIGTNVSVRSIQPDDGRTVWRKEIKSLSTAGRVRSSTAIALGLTQSKEFVFGMGRVRSGKSEDVLLFKMSKKDGSILWEKVIPSKIDTATIIDGEIIMAKDGSLFLGLATYGESSHITALRVDSELGEILWESKKFESPQIQHHLHLAESEEGWFVASEYGERGKPAQILVTRFDPANGKQIWEYLFENQERHYDTPCDLLVSGKDLYVLHSGGKHGARVSKLDCDAHIHWSMKIDSGYLENDQPVGLLIDDRNDIYVSSTCRNSWYFETAIDLCVVKLESENGAESWRTIIPISETKSGNLPIFSEQITAKTMQFDSQWNLTIMGTSWNGENLDLFQVRIDRSNRRINSRLFYDGPAGDHDFFVGASLPHQNYGFLAVGMTSRCRSELKAWKNLKYRIAGGTYRRPRHVEINTFHDEDPYNYDELIVRFQGYLIRCRLRDPYESNRVRTHDSSILNRAPYAGLSKTDLSINTDFVFPFQSQFWTTFLPANHLSPHHRTRPKTRNMNR